MTSGFSILIPTPQRSQVTAGTAKVESGTPAVPRWEMGYITLDIYIYNIYIYIYIYIYAIEVILYLHCLMLATMLVSNDLIWL